MAIEDARSALAAMIEKSQARYPSQADLAAELYAIGRAHGFRDGQHEGVRAAADLVRRLSSRGFSGAELATRIEMIPIVEEPRA